MKTLESGTRVIQFLEHEYGNNARNIVERIWKNANAEIKIEIGTLLPDMERYVYEWEQIQQVQQALEGIWRRGMLKFDGEDAMRIEQLGIAEFFEIVGGETTYILKDMHDIKKIYLKVEERISDINTNIKKLADRKSVV